MIQRYNRTDEIQRHNDTTGRRDTRRYNDTTIQRDTTRYNDTTIQRECDGYGSTGSKESASGRPRPRAAAGRRGRCVWCLPWAMGTVVGRVITFTTHWLPQIPVRTVLVHKSSLYINNRQPYGSLSNVLRKPAGEDGSGRDLT